VFGRMMGGATLLCCLASAFAPAEAQTETHCFRDSIKTVSSGGKIIIMISGAIYKIDDYDTFDTQMWLVAEDVLVCQSSEVIQGRRVSVYDLRNLDEKGDKVWAQKVGNE
jgi:hypothetical protein